MLIDPRVLIYIEDFMLNSLSTNRGCVTTIFQQFDIQVYVS